MVCCLGVGGCLLVWVACVLLGLYWLWLVVSLVLNGCLPLVGVIVLFGFSYGVMVAAA